MLASSWMYTKMLLYFWVQLTSTDRGVIDFYICCLWYLGNDVYYWMAPCLLICREGEVWVERGMMIFPCQWSSLSSRKGGIMRGLLEESSKFSLWETHSDGETQGKEEVQSPQIKSNKKHSLWFQWGLGIKSGHVSFFYLFFLSSCRSLHSRRLVWWQRCSVPICVLIRGIKYFPLWRSIKWITTSYSFFFGTATAEHLCHANF